MPGNSNKQGVAFEYYTTTTSTYVLGIKNSGSPTKDVILWLCVIGTTCKKVAKKIWIWTTTQLYGIVSSHIATPPQCCKNWKKVQQF